MSFSRPFRKFKKFSLTSIILASRNSNTKQRSSSYRSVAFFICVYWFCLTECKQEHSKCVCMYRWHLVTTTSTTGPSSYGSVYSIFFHCVYFCLYECKQEYHMCPCMYRWLLITATLNGGLVHQQCIAFFPSCLHVPL